MTKFLPSLLLGSSLLLTPLAGVSGADPDPGQVAVSVAKALEQLHYTRHPLDNQYSDRILHICVDTLDYSRLFFTQKDINDFEKKYDTEIDDDIWLGDVSPGYVIYETYVKRVDARVAKIKELLKNEKFDFTGNGSIEINREKAPWPKDDADADALWHDRIENELLTETLNQHPPTDKTTDKVDAAPTEKAAVKADADKTDADKADTAADKTEKTDKTNTPAAKAATAPAGKPETPQEVVAKRYDRLLRSLHEQTKEDQAKLFINALAQAYDPHSEYMSPSEMENFSIDMRLSLVGIGAMLQSLDGYAKIIELIPGGPAAVQGELKTDDRITAVAQGNAPFVDVIDMKLDKVVDLIRGKKASVVRLQVVPAGQTDTSKRKVIAITRDEVKLTEKEAHAEIIEHKDAQGQTERLGWITLPSFYLDINPAAGSKTPPKSTTRDMAALISRLNKENITGLVVDLRRNGGGSLDEAISATGLFIKKGPVVQSKDYAKQMQVLSDKDPSIAYSGPLVVLTSHLSASASEIFAGALQDYGRAVIVGDKNTFGKGTVQAVLEVGKFMSPFGMKAADAGALKLTIQKFYRPSGQSTQLKGVESDIVLPSRSAHFEVGEDALKYPLPYDEVKPADYDKWLGPPVDLADLRLRSETRVKNDPEFRYLEQDIAKMEQRIATNHLSLNKETREAEAKADEQRSDQIKAERLARKEPPAVTYELPLADVDKPKLQLLASKKEKADLKDKTKTPEQKAVTSEDNTGDDALAEDEASGDKAASDTVDPIRNESLNILADLVDQQRRVRLAKSKD
jgi:carboxyl-terminal processing protease